MSDLDELLGIDMTDPTQKLACDLVQAHLDLMGQLSRAREAAGLSRTDVAARMGTTTELVGDLESSSSDPCLSTLRRYALAVGVKIEHSVSRPGS